MLTTLFIVELCWFLNCKHPLTIYSHQNAWYYIYNKIKRRGILFSAFLLCAAGDVSNLGIVLRVYI